MESAYCQENCNYWTRIQVGNGFTTANFLTCGLPITVRMHYPRSNALMHSLAFLVMSPCTFFG